MQADLFTDEDLLALAAPLPQSGKVERSSIETAQRRTDCRAFADSREAATAAPVIHGADLLQLTLETYSV